MIVTIRAFDIKYFDEDLPSEKTFDVDVESTCPSDWLDEFLYEHINDEGGAISFSWEVVSAVPHQVFKVWMTEFSKHGYEYESEIIHSGL